MDAVNSDLLLQTVSYLNVLESSTLAATSQRMYFLVHQYRKLLGPQMSAASSACSSRTSSNSQLYLSCLRKLSVRPNLLFAFNTPRSEGSGLRDYLKSQQQRLQQGTFKQDGGIVVLGAVAKSIQANIDGNVQCDSPAAIMMGSLSADRTTMLPFDSPEGETDGISESVTKATPQGQDPRTYWKLFIVYVCGTGYYGAESFVSKLQAAHPEAAIVGGFCECGYVTRRQSKTNTEQLPQTTNARSSKRLCKSSDDDFACGRINHDSDDKIDIGGILRERMCKGANRTKQDLMDIDDGVFGIALGGDVPIRSIVSRGVKSLTLDSSVKIDQGYSSAWFVREAELLLPRESSYPFRGDPDLLKPVHAIMKLQNIETGEIGVPSDLISTLDQHQQPEFVGIRRANADGFELHPLTPLSFTRNHLLLMTDGSTQQEETMMNANIDMFALDGRACCEHMQATLIKLREKTKNDVILGGLLFSCNGRGPEERKLLQTPMADASLFHNFFPSTNLLGFYAGGEVGPMALVGNKDVFQCGKAAVQGFTAVVALFIVPPFQPGHYQLDDSAANVRAFLKSRFKQ